MRFVTFLDGGAVQPGILVPAGVVGMGNVFPDLLSIIAGGAAARERVEEAMSGAVVRPLSSVKLLAPIPRPPKVICVGLNYRDHAIESKMQIPDVPTIFCKFPTSVIGPDEPVLLPKNSKCPDYEAEFAFVIGKGGRHIEKDRWQDHVFGYMNLNDVSARDFQLATTQWMIGKTFDTFCPTGPWLVSADEIADPHNLDVRITINGEVLQHSNTRELIFRIPDLIAHLSSVFTLEPGDIVSTGTPAGVGFARTPPRYLQPGDEMVVQVEGLGDLRNPVVSEN